MMVRRKAFALCIDLASTIHGDDPGENMFNNTLVYLMKDVGCDGLVNINIGKLLPEGVNDGLDAIVTTNFCKLD